VLHKVQTGARINEPVAYGRNASEYCPPESLIGVTPYLLAATCASVDMLFTDFDPQCHRRLP
jgi:hypothetical protein